MRLLRTLLVSLATTGMVIAGPVQAAQPSSPSTITTGSANVRDVELDAQGTLSLQLMSSSGQPVAGQPVTIWSAEQPIAQASTVAGGHLRVTGIHGGLYRIQAGRQITLVRAWVRGTAPPAAVPKLLVVDQSNIARAQCAGDSCDGSCGGDCCGIDTGAACEVPGPDPFCGIFGKEPIMIGLLVAAAIAIPIAVHTSDDDAS